MPTAKKPIEGRPANLRVTLEQWQALQAVVDHGSYARAAEALHKSQSAVTYAVQKVESLLGVQAFEIRLIQREPGFPIQLDEVALPYFIEYTEATGQLDDSGQLPQFNQQ